MGALDTYVKVCYHTGMPLIEDSELAGLVDLATRMRGRVDDWFDDSEMTHDRAAKIPDQRVRECIGQIHKIYMDVAKIDLAREEKFKGLPTPLLEKQLRQEFLASSGTWTEEEWQELLRRRPS